VIGYADDGKKVALASMLQRFLSHPLHFKPSVLQANLRFSSNAGAATAAPAWQQQQQQERRRSEDNFDVHYHSMSPSSKLGQCGFKKVPSHFPEQAAAGAAAADGDSRHHRCGLFGTPRALVAYTFPAVYERGVLGETLRVFIDRTLHDKPEFAATLRASGGRERVQRVARLLRVMRCNIVRALPEQLSSEAVVPVIMVMCKNLHGFTHNGGVYVNVLPLFSAGERSTVSSHAHRTMCESLFLTLLHELAHRTHHEHDTFFADALGGLAFKCGTATASLITASITGKMLNLIRS
jgi:hypothetical protein